MATVEITTPNFDQQVSKGIVVLDFWAGWCAPCRAFAPIFERASEKHGDVVFGKVDTQAQSALADRFGIRSIPTVMAFKEGIPVFEQPGLLPAAMLDRLIEELRKLDVQQLEREVAEAIANEGRARG